MAARPVHVRWRALREDGRAASHAAPAVSVRVVGWHIRGGLCRSGSGEGARRRRPGGARLRVPSAGRGSADRPRRITLPRRAAFLRPAGQRGIPAVGPDEVRGACPWGRGGVGPRGSSAGPGSARRGRPGRRVRGDDAVLPRDPSPFDRPQGHPRNRPGGPTGDGSAGVVRRGRERAARAAGWARLWASTRRPVRRTGCGTWPPAGSAGSQ